MSLVGILFVHLLWGLTCPLCVFGLHMTSKHQLRKVNTAIKNKIRFPNLGFAAAVDLILFFFLQNQSVGAAEKINQGRTECD